MLRSTPPLTLATICTCFLTLLCADALPLVTIQTSLGDIVVEIDTVNAPVTATNFLRYVDEGLYADALFHRVVRMDNQPTDSLRIEVIQGSMGPDRRGQGHPAIPMEGTGTTGLMHLDGTISMARGGPDTATSSFFICNGAQPELDEGGMRNPDGRGFAAFGRVVSGMDIVRQIQAAPTDGQTLREPVMIQSIRRSGPAAKD